MSSSQPPLLEHATRDLAVFASALRFEDLPREVIERIKLSVLDSIGCCVFGATLPWTRKVADLAVAEGARSYEKLLLHRRGSPEHPLKPEDIEYKFRHVVSPCLAKASVDRIVKAVATFDELPDWSELIALVAASPGVTARLCAYRRWSL